MLTVLDEEQEMLAQTARQIAKAIGVAQPHDLAAVDDTAKQAAWGRLASSGLLGLRQRVDGVPAASGVEAMIVAHELGAHLVPVPFVTSGVLALELLELAHAGDVLTDGIASGGAQPGLLLQHSLLGLAAPEDKDAVLFGGRAEALALRPVDGGAQLVRVVTADAYVPSSAADLTGDVSLLAPGSAATALAGEHAGTPISEDDLARWMALALTMVSADCAGATRAALDGVVEYSKHRIAYGVPIGSFQALQHMCADAFTACEAAVTTNNYAAWAVDALQPQEALLAARTAKAWVASVGRDIVEMVMQVYGGIGQTWEHVAHLFTRRVLTDIALFGGENHQLDEIFKLRAQER